MSCKVVARSAIVFIQDQLQVLSTETGILKGRIIRLLTKEDCFSYQDYESAEQQKIQIEAQLGILTDALQACRSSTANAASDVKMGDRSFKLIARQFKDLSDELRLVERILIAHLIPPRTLHDVLQMELTISMGPFDDDSTTLLQERAREILCSIKDKIVRSKVQNMFLSFVSD